MFRVIHTLLQRVMVPYQREPGGDDFLIIVGSIHLQRFGKYHGSHQYKYHQASMSG